MSNKVRNLPDAPKPTDTPAEFNSKSFKWVDALSGWTSDVNNLGGDFSNLVSQAQAAASDADQKATQAGQEADDAKQSANASSQSAANSQSSAEDSAQSATKSYAQAEAAQAHAANADVAKNNAKDYADRSSDFADASENSAQASAKSAETSGYYQRQVESIKTEVTALSNKTDASAQLAENSKDSAQQYAQVAENWSNVAQDSAYNVLSGADALKWIKGTTYEIGDVVWSPKNAKIYRALFEFVSNTDPADDSENWVTASGLGSLAYQDASSVEVESLTITKNINNTVWVQLQPDDQEVLSAKELVHISSRGAARILLEADRNNVDEAANAQILLSQDGGSVTAHMGFWNETNSLYLLNLYKENLVLGTNAESIMWFTPDGAVQIRGGVTSSEPKFSIDTTADPDGSKDIHIVQVENKSGIVRKSVNVTTFADRRVGMSATNTQSGAGEQFLIEGSSVSLKDNIVVDDQSAQAKKPVVFTPQSLPSSPSEGMTYYDSVLKDLLFFDGVRWRSMASGALGDIGIPGTAGFGVGVCPEKLPDGMVPLAGYSDPESDNYGNYQASDGSIMVWIPAFYYKYGNGINGIPINQPDIKPFQYFGGVVAAAAVGYALHRAFWDGGKVKTGVMVDKYHWSNNGGIASSIKNGVVVTSGQRGSLEDAVYSALNGSPADNLGGSFAAAKTRGEDYFPASRFIHAALAMLALAHALASKSTAHCAWYMASANFPKGCNNNALGDVNDSSVKYQPDGNGQYLGCGLTGSANEFEKTTHNGQACGVADLNGLIWNFSPGMTSDGTNYYLLNIDVEMKTLTGGNSTNTDAFGPKGIAANYFSLGSTYEALWATGANRIVSFGDSGVPTFGSDTEGDAWAYAGFGAPLKGATNGTNQFGNDGLWDYKPNEMAPFSGGSWRNSSQAGVWGFLLATYRTLSDNTYGSRSGLYLN